MVWLVLLVVLFWGWDKAAANTINATSCSSTDVQNAVNQTVAGRDDVVVVPAGSCNWATKVVLPSRAFTLQGSGIDITTINDFSSYTGGNPGYLDWATASTGLHRITGFTFNNVTGQPSDTNNLMSMHFSGNSHSFRIDHNKFILGRSSQMRFADDIWGVIDHNTVVANTGSFWAYIFHNRFGGINNGCQPENGIGNGCGDGSWSLPRGNDTGIFFEDNTVTSNLGGCVNNCSPMYVWDGWSGGRFTVRFNNLTNVVVDAHGTDSARRSRSIRFSDYYRNRVTLTSGAVFTSLWGIRGGTGFVFQNIVTTQGTAFLTRIADLITYRSGCDNGVSIDCDVPFGACNGSNNWDHNIGPETGYQCLDQVGMGDDGLMNFGASPTPAWPNQTSEPVVGFRNLRNGSVQDVVTQKAIIKEGRDVYNQGTGNVFVASLTGCPSAASNNGKFCWATDQGTWNTATTAAQDPYSETPGMDGVLYRSNGTSWLVYFTPTVYPHPLVTGGSTPPDTTPPAAPTGVTIQ